MAWREWWLGEDGVATEHGSTSTDLVCLLFYTVSPGIFCFFSASPFSSSFFSSFFALILSHGMSALPKILNAAVAAQT